MSGSPQAPGTPSSDPQETVLSSVEYMSILREPTAERSTEYLVQPQIALPGLNTRTDANLGRSKSLARAKSLSRPERQRPRQGILRSPSQHREQMSARAARMQASQPMSQRLQEQLQRHKMEEQKKQQQQIQRQSILSLEQLQRQSIYGNYDIPSPKGSVYPLDPAWDEEEKDIKVREGYWAWTAFLVTCCIPAWFIRVCLRKTNPMMQQAWREKVCVFIVIVICSVPFRCLHVIHR